MAPGRSLPGFCSPPIGASVSWFRPECHGATAAGSSEMETGCSGRLPNVTLVLKQRHPQPGNPPPSNVTLPAQMTFLMPTLTRPSRSALRGAGTVGGPPGRLVPRLTIRPTLLAPAALAPLTASSGRGFRLPAVDVGPLRGRKPRSTSPALVRQPWPPVSPATRLAASRDHVQERCVSPVPSVVPRHRAGQRLLPSPTGKRRCGARALCPDVVTIVRNGGIGAGERERRPGGHRARHERLDDSPDRLHRSGTEIVHTPAPIWCGRRSCGRLGLPGDSRRTV